MNEDGRLEKIIHRQTRWRLAFVLFIVLFVYAQSYQGRVFIHRSEIGGCQRAQAAYHELHFRQLYVDCKAAYPAPTLFPW